MREKLSPLEKCEPRRGEHAPVDLTGSHHGSLSAVLALRMILIPLLSETHETQCAKPGGLSTSRPPTVGGSGAYRYRQKYQYVPGIEAMNGRNNT